MSVVLGCWQHQFYLRSLELTQTLECPQFDDSNMIMYILNYVRHAIPIVVVNPTYVPF